MAAGIKLYKKITDSLRQIVQNSDGELPFEIHDIDKDFTHILHCHVHGGNEETKTNVFIFFEKAVHYEDSGEQKENCVSVKRRFRRIKNGNRATESNEQKHNERRASTKPIGMKDWQKWQLDQYFIQSQLDTYHSFLVHPNWKELGKQHTKNEHEYKISEFQGAKYISEFRIGQVKEYGFGEIYDHHKLKPHWPSLQVEILNNEVCSLSKFDFNLELVKALKKHNSALEVKQPNNTLICKYYSKQYNIIRNEFIGVRHILAIVIYTDMTHFCTKFRLTYRELGKHCQLYHFARGLWEAVDFFGKELTAGIKLYHGLSVVLYFEKFVNQFNAPTSTTTSFKRAQEFSQGGIILELQLTRNLPTKIPKYLEVSWVSDFPAENEKLFYRSHFEIMNIYYHEGKKLKEYRKALKMFKKFQDTIQGQKVEWNEHDKIMIDELTKLLNRQQNYQKQIHGSDTSKCALKYDEELFSFVCRHQQKTQFAVQNYKALPILLFNALFGEESHMSLVPILKVFPYIREVKFTQLNISDIIADYEQYVRFVLEYDSVVNDINEANDLHGSYLKRIIIQSKPNNAYNCKKIKKIQTAATDTMMKQFEKNKWTVQYVIQHKIHIVTFTNFDEDKEKIMKTIQQKQQAYELKQIELRQQQINKQREVKKRQQKRILKVQSVIKRIDYGLELYYNSFPNTTYKN
eukprot:473540_1